MGEKQPTNILTASASWAFANGSKLNLTFALLDSIHAKADWVRCPLLPLCCSTCCWRHCRVQGPAGCRLQRSPPPLPPTLPRLTARTTSLYSPVCPTPKPREESAATASELKEPRCTRLRYTRQYPRPENPRWLLAVAIALDLNRLHTPRVPNSTLFRSARAFLSDPDAHFFYPSSLFLPTEKNQRFLIFLKLPYRKILRI